MRKPTTKTTTATATHTFTGLEAALIARALNEAAKLNRYGYDPEFNEDPLIGQRMLDLLGQHFSDARDAFQRADVLRAAVNLGFLPPPSGDVMRAAEAYLAEAEAAKETAKVAFRSRSQRAVREDAEEYPF